MQFQCADEVGYPLDEVFALVRDDMPALRPYLPDVEEITVLTRQEEAEGIRLVNQWRASTRSVPSVVQRFVKPDLLTWKDHAFWPHALKQAQWRLEPKVGGSLFECTGTTTLLPGAREGTTRIEIKGDLRVYPERLPGVPRFLAGSVRSKIEGFVVEMLVPNMQSMARGVQGYFDDKQRPPESAPAGS